MAPPLTSSADDRLLTSAEVAAIFGVQQPAVTRWARDGRLWSAKTPGGRRRYSESEVRALLGESR